MVKVEVFDEWIYESPDNGKTVYRRRFGHHYRELISNQQLTLFSYSEFIEIMDLSEKHPALEKALDNLRLIYYTIKDDEKDRT